MAFNGRTVLSKPDDGPVPVRLFYNLIFILVHTFVKSCDYTYFNQE